MSQWPMERMYPLHFQYNAANKELQQTVVVVGAAVALLSVKWTAAKNDGGNSRQLFLGDHNSDKLSPSPTSHLTTISDCRPSLHDDENLNSSLRYAAVTINIGIHHTTQETPNQLRLQDHRQLYLNSSNSHYHCYVV